MGTNTNTISARIRTAMTAHAEASQIAIVGTGSPVSYAELLATIDSFSAGFHHWGIKRGDFIGISAGKTVSTIAAYFGVIQAGGCPSVIDGALSAESVADQMASVGMHHLVCADEAELARNKAVITDASLCCLNELNQGGRYEDTYLEPKSRAMLLFTSGSTGKPKGVVLNHRAMICNAEGVIAHSGLSNADRLLHVMPLYHTNGINNQLVVPFLVGAEIVLMERFRAKESVQALRDWQPSYMTGVPTMYARMLPFLKPGERFAKLRFLRCGSAPITPTLHEQVENAFGVPLIVSYGLSEATCTSTMNPPEARRIGTIGTVLAGQTVALFCPGTDKQVPTGSEGEIRIAGPALMDGYLGSADQQIVDSWLHTGDIGQFDADGYLTITGRIKDVIIRGGENLSPALVESKIALDPSVRDCCVVGAPDADLGEVPIAFIVLNEGAQADAERIKDRVRANLSRIYVPAEIRFVDALPLNAVGKIDRKILRSWVKVPADAIA